MPCPGCQFNCTDASCEICPVCSLPDAQPVTTAVPFVNLPLGATEDRVLGSLDFERALKEGKKAFQPGLLASAHRGVLYIDEVNLLADHLVDVLLDAAASGVNRLQREGLSISHPARFMLIGTMNPEEGDLRPQLLDRFGIMVDVKAPGEANVRAEVVRRRLDFEKNPGEFSLYWKAETVRVSRQVAAAQVLLPTVVLAEPLLQFISELCCEMQVSSLRADIVMNKVARAAAALAGRVDVNLDDIRLAAQLVLPHRKRTNPTGRPGMDEDRLEQMLDEQKRASSQQNDDQDRLEGKHDRDQLEPQPDDGEAGEQNSGDITVFATDPQEIKWRVEMRSGDIVDTSGRRSTGSGVKSGQYVRAVPCRQPQSIAVDATVRHAVLRNTGSFSVSSADLHEKVRVKKHGNTIILLVDSSGSMAARKRMEAVKGAVASLLDDAYKRRDQVAVISCRGESADYVLPVTRSIQIANEKLSELPTGGRTPLASALAMARRTLAKIGKGPEQAQPLVVILSDGRANVSLSGDGQPWQESLEQAALIAQMRIPVLVIDSEIAFPRLGRARLLAEALSGSYVCLDELNAETLTLTIRRHLKGASR